MKVKYNKEEDTVHIVFSLGSEFKRKLPNIPVYVFFDGQGRLSRIEIDKASEVIKVSTMNHIITES